MNKFGWSIAVKMRIGRSKIKIFRFLKETIPKPHVDQYALLYSIGFGIFAKLNHQMVLQMQQNTVDFLHHYLEMYGALYLLYISVVSTVTQSLKLKF
jgi:hypothetical protein